MITITPEISKGAELQTQEDLRKIHIDAVKRLDSVEDIYDLYELGEAVDEFLCHDKMQDQPNLVVVSYLKENFGLRYERLFKAWRLFLASPTDDIVKWNIIDRNLSEWAINRFNSASLDKINLALKEAIEGEYIDAAWWKKVFPPAPKKQKAQCPEKQVSTIPQPDGQNATLVVLPGCEDTTVIGGALQDVVEQHQIPVVKILKSLCAVAGLVIGVGTTVCDVVEFLVNIMSSSEDIISNNEVCTT